MVWRDAEDMTHVHSTENGTQLNSWRRWRRPSVLYFRKTIITKYREEGIREKDGLMGAWGGRLPEITLCSPTKRYWWVQELVEMSVS